uniref:Uncharacterized protein n=1 Tax=Sphaerodactylus townsendi TaxID=933632 RepID=A0ACB8EQ97_9SAUR
MAGAGVLQQRLAGLEARLCRLRTDGGSDDPFLMQASGTLGNLRHLFEDGGENSTFSNLLQLYAQAILDITYFEENQLVDEDFMEVSSLQKVEELIHVLSEPETLIEGSSENEFLSEGVNYLVKMLGFRCSVNPIEDFGYQDPDTARLLHEGKY